jgi:hypothetical protein
MGGASSIWGRDVPESEGMSKWKICQPWDSITCLEATAVKIIHYFDFCRSETDLNCIASVWAITSSGQKITGNYVKRFPSRGNADFPAIPELELSDGRGGGLVIDIPGVTHSGRNSTYHVSAINQTVIFKNKGQKLTDRKNYLGSFSVSIIPFSEVSGSLSRVNAKDGWVWDGGRNIGPNGEVCFVQDTGACAVEMAFPTDTRLGLSLRLSDSATGWFHGRLRNPDIQTRDLSRGQEISITANPIDMPELDFLVPTRSLSQEVQDFIFSERDIGYSSDISGTRFVSDLSSESLTPELLRLFTPSFRDTATRNNSTWSLKTLGYHKQDDLRRCSDGSGSLAGIVTTNSLVYSPGPPALNSLEQSLDYKLTSPHFNADGSVASGSYDLMIRSSVARCIYGFSSAPIKASIEILSNEGSSKIATTVVTQSDDWLLMSANGFEFSSPIVRAKFTQEKVEVRTTAAPSPSPIATLKPTTVPKKTSISCKKGTSVKKLSGKNSRCPRGWKKT